MKKTKSHKKIQKTMSRAENIRVLVGLILLVALLILYKCVAKEEIKMSDVIEISTFSAIVLAFALDWVAKMISRKFQYKIEDWNKLTEDYDALVGKYSRVPDFFLAVNDQADERNVKAGREFTSCKTEREKKEEKKQRGKQPKKKKPAEEKNQIDEYRLPVCGKISLRGKKVEFDDHEKKTYELNEYVYDRLHKFSHVHEFSKTYNNMNIRLDGITEKNGTLFFHTSRTKYYHSLMTNRSIDYKIDGFSYRELFEEGPFLRDLEESTLSNHLGFNGYVETTDGKFVFILRHNHVSIGKNMLQNSIGASLKAKFVLGEDKKVTKEGVIKAMRKEIVDELRLVDLENFEKREEDIFKNFTFENNVLYYYRDLVEGGKPQLMFYVKLPISSEELAKSYVIGVKGKAKDEDLYTSVDGYKMLLVDREEICKTYLAPDCFVIDGKAYRAMPSSVATHIMLMEYLKNENC